MSAREHDESKVALDIEAAYRPKITKLQREVADLKEELRIAQFDADVPLRELREENDRLRARAVCPHVVTRCEVGDTGDRTYAEGWRCDGCPTEDARHRRRLQALGPGSSVEDQDFPGCFVDEAPYPDLGDAA